jgi:hypothetical protein
MNQMSAITNLRRKLEDFEERYYPAIGRAIVAWAKLEIKLDEQLLFMLSHERASTARQKLRIQRVAHLPKAFECRLDICNELSAIFYDKKPKAEFLRITKACRSLIKDRNKLAHGQWIVQFLPKRPPAIVCQLRQHGTPGKERQFSVSQIKQMSQSYDKATDDLTRFAIDHHPDGPLTERLREFFRSRQNNRTRARRSATPTKRHEKRRRLRA